LKIHSITRATSEADLGTKPHGTRASTTPKQADSAQVALSPLSVQLQSQMAAQDTAGDIDVARVAAISDAIRSGRLSINPERIADGLLDSARDLLHRPRS
jgi:negative regulator of flagellin synthesis FlgM